jgi:hypothetical protein
MQDCRLLGTIPFLMRRIGRILGAVVCLMAIAADQPKVFKPDADGFILNWLVLDPISLNDIQHTEAGVQAIVAREYFKDQLAALPKDSDTVSGADGAFQWHAVNSKDYVVSLTGFASDYNKPVVNELFWGVAYVTVPDEMKDVRLAIGSDDDSVWWINGKEVIHAYGMRQTATDDNVSKRLVLNKGVNVIRFAVVQGDGPSDCCARFLDAKQNPITNLTISLVPPNAAP